VKVPLLQGTKEVVSMSIKAYKYRIETNKATADKLQWAVDRARERYNAGATSTYL
jgi:hypothetical protein